MNLCVPDFMNSELLKKNKTVRVAKILQIAPRSCNASRMLNLSMYILSIDSAYYDYHLIWDAISTTNKCKSPL